MAIIDDTCEDGWRDEPHEIGYTGVDPHGEVRECPACLAMVRLEPQKDEVIHQTLPRR